MLFNTLQFGVFLALVLGFYYAAPRGARNGILLVASLAFYALWIPAYLPLLLADIVVNYALLRWLTRSRRPRIVLLASCTVTLGVLAWFKYAAMLVESLLPVLDGVFGRTLPVPEVLLPLGISFYSFQILALAVDCYRGQIAPPETLWRYALFIAYFPQLIAGPILRGRQFLPQLERGGACTAQQIQRGLWLIVVGLGKKVILADLLLAPFVDAVFRLHSPAVPSFHWLAAWSFAFQVYYDFSGYSDIARGLALLMGFELPLNFREPYLARNPAEFWRRWHITLSTWLNDYLFVPLGGGRWSRLRTARNLFVTMLLGGLWHGASWTFVVWGALHGLLLAGHRLLVKRPTSLQSTLGASDLPRILLLFNLVALLLVFFRAESLAHATHFLGVMVRARDPYGWPIVQIAVVLLCALLHPTERWLRLRLPVLHAWFAASWWRRALEGAVLGAVVGLAVMASGAGGDFIYFQF